MPFEQVFERVQADDVVYCDPPYAPLSSTASFTSYSGQGFNCADQQQLADCAWLCAQRDVPVLISNHDLASTRAWYQQASLTRLDVRRTISSKGAKRDKVAELLALYTP